MMSGQGNQPNQGGGQPQGGQGGQPRGGQPQGGQPQGGQPQGQPQGGQPQGQPPQGQPPQGQPPQGQPPQGGGGGDGNPVSDFVDDVDTDSFTEILKFGVAALAIAGLVFGLTPFLAGFVGSSATDTAPANGTLAGYQADNTSKANNIVSGNLSSNNLSAANAYDSMQYQNGIVRTIVGFAPYFGILLTLIIGLLITMRFDVDEKTLAAGVAATAIAGLIVFTLLGSAVAGFQYNSMSTSDWQNQYNTNPADWSSGNTGYPPSDVNTSTFSGSTAQPSDATIGGSAFGGRISTISAFQIKYLTLIINSIAFGIVAGLGAAGMAVATRRLEE